MCILSLPIRSVGQRTIRGCQSEVEDQLDITCTNDNCSICNTDHCNINTYPDDRLVCNVCETCDKIENTREHSVCENYVENDTCYVVADQVANPETSTIDIVSYRGCSSSQDEGTAYCLTHPEKCITCSGSGCNNDPTYGESTLKCYKCDSANTINCLYNQEWLSTEKCEYNKFLGASEHCYTHMTPDGAVTRGCLHELPTNNAVRMSCEAGDEDCQMCTAEGCNKDTTEPYYGQCVHCDGNTDPNCGQLEESYTISVCGPSEVGGCFRSEVREFKNHNLNCKRSKVFNKHFMKFSFSDGTVVRSCVSDLLPGEVAFCQAGEECKICQGDLCNLKGIYLANRGNHFY